MKTKILESRVGNLCDELRNSGKYEPADYYEKLLNKIIAPSSETEKSELLQQIISSGKLSDLANFTLKEDRLFNLVYEEAKKLKGQN